ncbi:proline--tRNA ligase [Candidatus Schneideria nysicola]|uniref:proline--tRNA ligase n=1 Tax=Candidatus Schneideria nysicola TaxID=1081631 RepID=UPI001CAA5F4A|nr:proline--tRNA ligase [Candidatus Schneideria nysicola]UAJ65731.1 proline--tRNA ligase [Candidatus Schneideria nysicola]
MRTSQYLLFTLKEIPNDAEVISHQLMIRAGMIRKLASGLYTWLPTGLRVIKKVENIIRKKMNKIGAIEILMPIMQPANLWSKSGRLSQYGSELFRFSDRSTRAFLLGPTHEEVITDLIRSEINSYKKLPLIFFQIHTKFRDEARPRFGIIRSREFLMKDAYSFHMDQQSLQSTYDVISNAYKDIFTTMNLKFCRVKADTGSIGGHISHEFHAFSDRGEDSIVLSSESTYAANIELAETNFPLISRPEAKEVMQLVNVPDIYTMKDLINKFNIPIEKTVQTFIVRAKKDLTYRFVALVIRGDHQLNKIKAEKLNQISVPLTFATEEEIYKLIGNEYGVLGPLNLKCPMIIDRSVAVMSDFIAGSNMNCQFFFGINWGRDINLPQIADIRNIIEGEMSPDRIGTLQIKRGIEIGHIFQIGKKYSELIHAKAQDKNGHNKTILMGCYGIGITRLLAAVIEQNNDESGILWPEMLAPFRVAILPVGMHHHTLIQETVNHIYNQLVFHDIEVLLDDREEHIGVMFTDMELIGIPHILIISYINLKKGEIEYNHRRKKIRQNIKIADLVHFLLSNLE